MREGWSDYVMEGPTWQDYVTNLPWGRHPAGTPCKARRQDGMTVVMLFEDGTRVEAKGYYLKGLDMPYQQGILGVILDRATAEIHTIEDERVFKALNAVAQEWQDEIAVKES